MCRHTVCTDECTYILRRTYRHEFHHMLNVVNVKAHRIALTGLILSSHNLHIETGRWTRPVTQQIHRYCVTCPGKIEDEYHLVIECPQYLDIRNRLIPHYYRIRPSMFKLGKLFNTDNSKLIRCLAKFVYCALKDRI